MSTIQFTNGKLYADINGERRLLTTCDGEIKEDIREIRIPILGKPNGGIRRTVCYIVQCCGLKIPDYSGNLSILNRNKLILLTDNCIMRDLKFLSITIKSGECVLTTHTPIEFKETDYMKPGMM
jgi:hypothetical protein